MEQTGEALVARFTAMLHDPQTRGTLEPAGAISKLRFQTDPDTFGAAWSKVPAGEKPAVAEALMALGDPLAARLAVTLAGADESAPEIRQEWLDRALAHFPEDPELLLAQALMLVSKRTTTGQESFRRALLGLSSLAPFPRDSEPLWCGARDYTEGTVWEPETVAAIVAFADRAGPSMLPKSWAQALEKTLTDPDSRARLGDLRAATLALMKYRAPWPSDMGPDQFPWSEIVKALEAAGDVKTAAQIAEAALSDFRGDLIDPEWQGHSVRPWANGGGPGVTGRGSDGWRLLMAAKAPDPVGLADRLSVLSQARPSDEKTALSALLARAQLRPLTAEDVVLPTLAAAGRHRVVEYASWLLPSAELPRALCLEAWEAQASACFARRDWSFPQGLRNMELLRAEGGQNAFQHLIPAMLGCLAELGDAFPVEVLPSIFEMVRESSDVGARDALKKILARRVRGLPRDDKGIGALFYLLFALPSMDDMPAELVKRVDETLSAAARDGWNYEEDRPLAFLATVAAAHPHWHGALRAVVKDRKSPTGRSGERWNLLRALLQTLDGGLALPDVALRFETTAPGEGTLHWNFQGIQLPPVSDSATGRDMRPAEPAWTPLSAGMAGAFDATFFADGQGAAGPVVAAAVPALPASGSVEIKGLPAVGRLRLLLAGNTGRRPAGEGRLIPYNSLPPLLDSSRDEPLPGQQPSGWRLLSRPVPLTEDRDWHVEAPGGHLPARVSLLLLDESGEVCFASRIPWNDDVAFDENFTPFFSGFLAPQDKMGLWIPPAPAADGARAPWVTAAPRTLALGIPEEAVKSEAPASADGPAAETTSTPEAVRITVRPWRSAPKAQEPPNTGILGPMPTAPVTALLEVVKSWGLAATTRVRPVIGFHPLRASWTTDGELHVMDLEGPRSDPPRVVTRKFEPVKNDSLPSMYWHGDSLSLFSHFRSGDRAKDRTTVAIVRAYQPDAPPVTVEFPGSVSPLDRPAADSAYLPLIQNVRDVRGFLGVLTPEGGLLEWPASSGTPPPPEKLGAPEGARLAFTDTDGRHLAMDWSDGTIKVLDAPPPEEDATPVWIRPGEEVDYRQLPYVFGRLPLPADAVLSLGEGRFLATPSNFQSVSLTLLRETTPKKAP